MKEFGVIFMGTPDISKIYLQTLIEKKFNIIAVYTQPPRKKDRGLKIKKSSVHELAEKNNISIYHPTNFDSRETVNELNKLNPSIVVVMGYGVIIPKNVLKIPQHGFINIHLSLLPRWRGAAPIEYAIFNGDSKTGVSIFQIEEKLDSGPIIDIKEIDIEKNVTKEELTKKLNLVGKEMLVKVLNNIINDGILSHDQDDSKATYAKKIKSNFRKINFNLEVSKVYNHIRAFSPRPAAWFFINNERINIIKCSMKICDPQPSIILNNKFEIGCINGKIVPEIIQREGKRPVSTEEFLRGYKFDVGQIVNAKI